MAKFIPAGFNRAEIIANLHDAMTFGQPTRAADQATFAIFDPLDSEVPVDDQGVPFDATVRPTRTPRSVRVPCATEFVDRPDGTETFGSIQPTRVKITLLDPDYQKVKGFSYVVMGGDKYNYRLTEPPVALGSIDVWIVHVTAEDEG